MDLLAENKQARLNYEILETLNAGIALTGHEVKSLKSKQASLESAYIIVDNNQASLIGLNISSFQPSNAPPDYRPDRNRRLLLQKNELKSLIGKKKQGLTIIPINIYSDKRGLIKVTIAVARGRKKYDRRELIKKREVLKGLRRLKKR